MKPYVLSTGADHTVILLVTSTIKIYKLHNLIATKVVYEFNANC